MSAPTKSRTAIWTSQALTGGAGNTTSGWIDLSTFDGSNINIILTNGGTGPTIAAQVQVQVSNNYNAGSPTMITNYGGPLVGSVTNSAVAYASIPIPKEVAAVRLVAGSNTAQNVTVDADISSVTGYA